MTDVYGIIWTLLLIAAGWYLGRTYERHDQRRAAARRVTGRDA